LDEGYKMKLIKANVYTSPIETVYHEFGDVRWAVYARTGEEVEGFVGEVREPIKEKEDEVSQA